MSNYNSLKATINANIKANGNQEITGPVLNSVLTQIVNSLGANYQLVGMAVPSTNPGTPDQNVAYIAGQGGVYSYFDGFEVLNNQIVIFKYNGSWSHQVIVTFDLGLDITYEYGKNLYNSEAIERGYIAYLTGAAVPLDDGQAYFTDWIPIDSRGLWVGNMYTYGNVGGYAIYDKNRNYIRGARTTNLYIEYQPGDAWVRATINTGSSYVQQINVGSTFDSPVVPYVIPALYISTPRFHILQEQIPDGTISTAKVADGAITMDKFGPTALIRSKNMLDPSAVESGRWINANGRTAQVNPTYGYYPYIEVEENTNYHISNASGNALSNRSDCYIAFYDEGQDFISSVPSNTTDITTPAGCKYVRISVVMARLTQAQMEVGSVRTAYEEYFAPRLYIDPDVILFPNNGVTTEKIADGAVTQDKIADGVSLPASPAQFGSWRNSGTLQAGQTLTTPLVRVTKNTRIVATIRGAIQSVEVGVSRLGFYGRWVEITPTKIIVKYGTTPTIVAEYEHGLTLGTITKIIISKTISSTSLGSATIKLVDDYGNIYSSPSVTWGMVEGDVFVYNGNASTSIVADLSFMVADITKQIWMFGDSYFSFTDAARWLYYPLSWGYLSYLVNAMGGENATQAFADLQNLLTTGAVPSMIVWCMGMNGGADTSGGAINTTWLSITTQLEALCQQYGITLILATIPSVPSQIHTALNNWVRNSGHRYIDFAAAVEQSNSNYWRGWGTANALLSSDEIHPTSHGAVELAMRALLDFPEMMVKEN